MNKTYSPEPLNKQASVIVDAQTDIKLAVKNGILTGQPSYVTKAKILEIIDKSLRLIKSTELKKNAQISLMQFAERVYMRLKAVLPNPMNALAIYTLIKATDGKKGETFIPKNFEQRQATKQVYGGFFHTTEKGIPLQEFQKDYFNKVNNALEDIANMHAIDADDIIGRNSLRNFAEMQVRYERHQNEIKELKEKGVKLVVCSVHGDCSDRCFNWQGRVYSLDGTKGTTEDGREYVPLEVATDIYYTTKKGKTYKNGLLGFNCRHKLYPYKTGMVIPKVLKEEQKKEDAITKEQRRLERAIIHWREQALMAKGVNAKAYKRAKSKATELYNRYKEFSLGNERAFYPDRIKIL